MPPAAPIWREAWQNRTDRGPADRDWWHPRHRPTAFLL